MSVLEQLEQEKITALSELERAQTETELESWRLAHLGKSSPVMQAFSGLGSASKEERPLIGKAANAVKTALEGAYAAKHDALRQLALARAWRTSAWTSPCPDARRAAAGCTRSTRPCAKFSVYSETWAFRSITHQKWKPTITTSPS